MSNMDEKTKDKKTKKKSTDDCDARKIINGEKTKTKSTADCGTCHAKKITNGEIVDGKVTCATCLKDLTFCSACGKPRSFSCGKGVCEDCGWSPLFIRCHKCQTSVTSGTLSSGLFLCLTCCKPPSSSSTIASSNTNTAVYGPNAGKPGYDQWGDELDRFS